MIVVCICIASIEYSGDRQDCLPNFITQPPATVGNSKICTPADGPALYGPPQIPYVYHCQFRNQSLSSSAPVGTLTHPSVRILVSVWKFLERSMYRFSSRFDGFMGLFSGLRYSWDLLFLHIFQRLLGRFLVCRKVEQDEKDKIGTQNCTASEGCKFFTRTSSNMGKLGSINTRGIIPCGKIDETYGRELVI